MNITDRAIFDIVNIISIYVNAKSMPLRSPSANKKPCYSFTKLMILPILVYTKKAKQKFPFSHGPCPSYQGSMHSKQLTINDTSKFWHILVAECFQFLEK